MTKKESISILKNIQEVEQLLATTEDLPPPLEAAINVLLITVQLLVDRLNLNSRNSSTPPSSDPNREKKKRGNSNKPRGGQQGHIGTNLKPVSEPDEIKYITIDRRKLPAGNYVEEGYESRQVFDIRICRHVTEYRAHILKDEFGNTFVAEFPASLSQSVQYGASIKANSVYMSMFQLIPYARIQTHFAEQFGIPISAGSIFNFNEDAYQRLRKFEALVKAQLRNDDTLHVDETGINIDGNRLWLHSTSNALWTWLETHSKRGSEAMDDIGVLPNFHGVLVHDHWKPYYRYDHCQHVLCNAHHKRELTRAYEQDHQEWAQDMENLLDQMNKAVNEAGGSLSEKDCKKWRRKYRAILKEADTECPPPDPELSENKKRGRQARSKSRNLLERLRDYEEDVLRFMINPLAPYTNNQAERDLRMAKVQQKISGCFRSVKGAEIYSRIRSYLSTCQKHQVGVGEALECLFAGTWPEFIQQALEKFDLAAE